MWLFLVSGCCGGDALLEGGWLKRPGWVGLGYNLLILCSSVFKQVGVVMILLVFKQVGVVMALFLSVCNEK